MPQYGLDTPSPPDPRFWIPLKQAARKLGVSDSSVRKLIQREQLLSTRFEGRLYIAREQCSRPLDRSFTFKLSQEDLTRARDICAARKITLPEFLRWAIRNLDAGLVPIDHKARLR